LSMMELKRLMGTDAVIFLKRVLYCAYTVTKTGSFPGLTFRFVRCGVNRVHSYSVNLLDLFGFKKFQNKKICD
ncbi:hypothetical protein ACJX0J_017370, partial [Zea mays]